MKRKLLKAKENLARFDGRGRACYPHCVQQTRRTQQMLKVSEKLWLCAASLPRAAARTLARSGAEIASCNGHRPGVRRQDTPPSVTARLSRRRTTSSFTRWASRRMTRLRPLQCLNLEVEVVAIAPSDCRAVTIHLISESLLRLRPHEAAKTSGRPRCTSDFRLSR